MYIDRHTLTYDTYEMYTSHKNIYKNVENNIDIDTYTHTRTSV